MNRALLSSQKNDWCTPDVVLELVREVGDIGLDPATGPGNVVGAKSFFTPQDNGLSQPWVGHGLVFVNPPYGRQLGEWTAHARMQAKCGAEIIALLPARTDTRWWQNDVLTAERICFWQGRLRFRGAPAPAPFPSALVYWQGNKHVDYKDAQLRGAKFDRVFQPRGWVVRP